MKQIIDNIRHHSEIFGEPVYTEFFDISEERKDLVISIIKSELKELKSANSIHEQKDGCGDVLWTIIRAFQENGIKFNSINIDYTKPFVPYLTSISKIDVLLHDLRHTAVGEQNITKVLNELFKYAIELFRPFDYDMGYIMDKVYKGNMSKLCITETEAQSTVKAYFNGTHPNKLGVKIETYYKKAKKGFVVYRKSDNKYLKSINFVEPKFN